MRTHVSSLQIKFVALALLVASLLSATSSIAINRQHQAVVQGEYVNTAARVGESVGLLLRGAESGPDGLPDARTAAAIAQLQRTCGLEYIAVVELDPAGAPQLLLDTRGAGQSGTDMGELLLPDGAALGAPTLREDLSFAYYPLQLDGGAVAVVHIGFSGEALLEARQLMNPALREVFLLSFLLVLVFVLGLYKIVILPIHKISLAVGEFLEMESYDAAHQSPLVGLDISSNDEIGKLARNIKLMESKIKENVRRLQAVTLRAETDTLTRLYNREAFRQRVDSFLCSEAAGDNLHAYFMVDIDNFKAVNDTAGHVVGDELLAECARRLKGIFRSSDEIARVGGDEFAVFCKSVGDMAVIESKARLICEAWSGIPVNGYSELKITASVGISIQNGDGGDYRTLYERADAALYKAKTDGKNRYVVYTDSLEEARRITA